MDTFASDKQKAMEIPKRLQEFLFGKRFRVFRHLLFWLFIYADEVLGVLGLTENLETPGIMWILNISADMFMVYLNLYVLIPRLFLKGRISLYFLWTVLSVLAVILSNYWTEYGSAFEGTGLVPADYYDFESYNFVPPDIFTYIVGSSWTNAGIVALAVAFKLFQESFSSNVKIQNLREDKLKTELAYLKTQVNPHFLFNTLNNMYVMARKKNDNLPDTIMQLSDLLRYQLYDTEEDLVPLDKEITYLKNYLELEQLRRQHLTLEFEISGNTGSQKIRPLILLPYIENAFKYSNSGSGSDFIKISLNAKPTSIEFSVENNKGTLHRRDVGGIGMENASRRLELAYPDKHVLDISETDEAFLVSLKLDTL